MTQNRSQTEQMARFTHYHFLSTQNDTCKVWSSITCTLRTEAPISFAGLSSFVIFVNPLREKIPYLVVKYEHS